MYTALLCTLFHKHTLYRKLFLEYFFSSNFLETTRVLSAGETQKSEKIEIRFSKTNSQY